MTLTESSQETETDMTVHLTNALSDRAIKVEIKSVCGLSNHHRFGDLLWWVASSPSLANALRLTGAKFWLVFSDFDWYAGAVARAGSVFLSRQPRATLLDSR